jgi:murein L,D-transpeptidase YcbB/YkuD
MPTHRAECGRLDALRWRAHFAAFAVVFVALFTNLASDARAQSGNWWEGIQSFPPSYKDKSKNAPSAGPRQDTLNDLRPDDVPWRSDEMLAAIDRAIERYQTIVSKGGWPQVPGNRMLRPGDDDERVAYLRKRLRITGELQGSTYDDYTFDSGLESAVVRFQEHNGLRASGRVDQPTLAALNITAEERLAQLQLNRGRIAELMQSPPEERYVLVNVPAFQLEAVDRYSVHLRHRVIVGRPGRDTPTLKAMIRGLNFFPYWKVPDSVAQLDIIPRLQKEPDYLAKEQIRVLAGDFNGHELDSTSIDWFQATASKIKFRQDPGPQNALGLVRIDMQNEHGVYMHDTPMKPLFQQRSRPFSAGCVRVQDVFQLVEWIARFEPGWEEPGRVRAVLEQGQALDVNLTRPVPVYFAYITAWAEADGQVEFRPDIYKRDGSQAVAEVFDPEAPPPPQQGFAP